MTSEHVNPPLPLEIRERHADELPLEVDIYNEAFPPDWHSTVEEAQSWESMQRPEDDVLRLLAFNGDEAVGAGRSFHSPHAVPGRFELDVAVRPGYRRRGVGRALYQRLAAFAAEKHAKELEAGVRVTLLPDIEKWLADEGYDEVSRMRESQLDLQAQATERKAEALRLADKADVTLITLADIESPATRQKLWQLSVITDRDIPFDTVHADEPLERFAAMIDSPLCLHDCLVVAQSGNEFAGFTITARQTADRAFTWATGVHPDFRGRGIAQAMKLYAAAIAREKGFTAMRTFNHTNNRAMLAVNVGMGYQPLPEVVFFVKRLSS